MFILHKFYKSLKDIYFFLVNIIHISELGVFLLVSYQTNFICITGSYFLPLIIMSLKFSHYTLVKNYQREYSIDDSIKEIRGERKQKRGKKDFDKFVKT